MNNGASSIGISVSQCVKKIEEGKKNVKSIYTFGFACSYLLKYFLMILIISHQGGFGMILVKGAPHSIGHIF